MLEALRHHQNIILLKTDNSTAEAFSTSTLKEKRSKAWDMRLYWIKDRVTGKEFLHLLECRCKQLCRLLHQTLLTFLFPTNSSYLYLKKSLC